MAYGLIVIIIIIIIIIVVKIIIIIIIVEIGPSAHLNHEQSVSWYN